MAFAIVDDVRGYFMSRPPLVLFMICLASFAIALITFAYVIKVKDMPNPDITEDWNKFLDRLSTLDYCVVSEPGAEINTVTQAPVSPSDAGLKERIKQTANHFLGNTEGAGVQGPTISSATPTISPSSVPGLINVSVLIDLELMPTSHFLLVSSRNNFTFITTTLRGSQLGLTGGHQDLEANVTLVLPPLGNHSLTCQHGQCYKLKDACITMIAPRQFFPRTQRPFVDEICLKEGDYIGENHFHLEVTPSYLHCINASILSLYHQYDPTLTVMLTMQDRSIINLHLMHTSYFLFVMILTLFCYAIIKGRPSKVKIVYTQCPTDKSSNNQP